MEVAREQMRLGLSAAGDVREIHGYSGLVERTDRAARLVLDFGWRRRAVLCSSAES